MVQLTKRNVRAAFFCASRRLYGATFRCRLKLQPSPKVEDVRRLCRFINRVYYFCDGIFYAIFKSLKDFQFNLVHI